jgi:hypothetical protein
MQLLTVRRVLCADDQAGVVLLMAEVVAVGALLAAAAPP